MNARPIETRYAGCRFRSRLEARWAVFFDHLGIAWEYEPQGFDINGRAYLPDFLLTDCGTWVEVKGAEADLDGNLMRQAALHLPRPPHRYEPGPNLLILGPIPEPPRTGELGWVSLSRFADEDGTLELEDGYSGFGSYSKNCRPWRLYNTSTATPFEAGSGAYLVPQTDPYEDGRDAAGAYRAARSARFEHGSAGWRASGFAFRRLAVMPPTGRLPSR
ncbi:hypothetical protein [Kitasatospora sp. NPDC001683]